MCLPRTLSKTPFNFHSKIGSIKSRLRNRARQYLLYFDSKLVVRLEGFMKTVNILYPVLTGSVKSILKLTEGHLVLHIHSIHVYIFFCRSTLCSRHYGKAHHNPAHPDSDNLRWSPNWLARFPNLASLQRPKSTIKPPTKKLDFSATIKYHNYLGRQSSLKNARLISQSVKIVSTQHLTKGNYRQIYYGGK